MSLYVALFSMLMMTAKADEIHVAVASNFAVPLREIAANFEKMSGHRLVVSSAATAKTFAQIRNGAPFDVWLAADAVHPQKLVQERLAEETPVTYAVGKLVLFSAKRSAIDRKDLNGKILVDGKYRHLAIANPELAPYGAAAREVLEKKGLWKTVQPKLVLGENIAQTFQFVVTGNAELGFVAFSQIMEREPGSYWLVPQSLYSPIRQNAVLLKAAEKKRGARDFLLFLKSSAARSTIEKYGYGLGK